MSRILLYNRYGLMVLHALLWLIILPLCIVETGSGLMLILHAVVGLALLIYVPAAMYISLKDSGSTFDQAGGEIAYLAIQLIGWIAILSGGIVLEVLSDTGCHNGLTINDKYNTYGYRPDGCTALLVNTGFAGVQIVIIAIWLGIVGWKANHIPTLKTSAAMRLPTHRLLVNRTTNGEIGDGSLKLDTYS